MTEQEVIDAQRRGNLTAKEVDRLKSGYEDDFNPRTGKYPSGMTERQVIEAQRRGNLSAKEVDRLKSGGWRDEPRDARGRWTNMFRK